jgi:hypothetical protein
VHDLPWFQKILAELLRPPRHDDLSVVAGLKEVAPTGADPAGGGKGAEPVDDEEATIRARRALWDQAARSHDRLRRRLMAMEPSDRMASRLWPVAVAHLLVTLLTRRHAAGRDGGDLRLPRVADLVSGFLAALFIERSQHDDYHPREGGRYPGMVFPPLAADLHESFGQGPHEDLAKILLLLFAHWYAHRQRPGESSFPDRAWLVLVGIPRPMRRMVTEARTRGSLVLPRGANRKSRRSAGPDRIATGERRNKDLVASATIFLQSLAPSRRPCEEDQRLAPDRSRKTTKVCGTQRSGRNRPPKHCPRRCLMPSASRRREESPGSRLRASEQSPHGKDRGLRSR